MSNSLPALAAALALFLLLATLPACQPRPAGTVDAPKEAATMPATPVPVPSAWTIVSCARGGRTTAAVNDKGFVAVRETSLGGNTGCNSFGADYTPTKDGRWEVPGAMATKMFCAEANEQERMVLEVFNGTVRPAVDGNTLTLTNEDVTLTLRRDDARL